jgi:hypothetical protein
MVKKLIVSAVESVVMPFLRVMRLLLRCCRCRSGKSTLLNGAGAHPCIGVDTFSVRRVREDSHCDLSEYMCYRATHDQRVFKRSCRRSSSAHRNVSKTWSCYQERRTAIARQKRLVRQGNHTSSSHDPNLQTGPIFTSTSSTDPEIPTTLFPTYSPGHVCQTQYISTTLSKPSRANKPPKAPRAHASWLQHRVGTMAAYSRASSRIRPTHHDPTLG